MTDAWHRVFDDRYIVDDKTGCFNGLKVCGERQKWYWPILHQGRWRVASRVSFELWNGLGLAALCACHKCDNPRCVNPEHIFSGTRGDNNRDTVAKRRHWQFTNPENRVQGEWHKFAKLSLKEARIIKASAISSRKLAQEYGVARSLIQRIKLGKSWPQA